MNVETFNALHEVGTPVLAYPGARPEDDLGGEQLITRTRTRAQRVCGHSDVVWVDGHGAWIALSHVDPVTEAEWEKARNDRDAATVARRAALLAAVQERPSLEWKPGLAVGALRRAGIHPVSIGTASKDLQDLAAEGLLVAHTETVIRGYGLPETAPGGEVTATICGGITANLDTGPVQTRYGRDGEGRQTAWLIVGDNEIALKASDSPPELLDQLAEKAAELAAWIRRDQQLAVLPEVS
ncbi:hypothetical protein ABZ725_14040 [Streptomyces sp. NPDC006872]|uniref:hypothetical protein n=1 Tax=Streptomyces sp. NPDC006872 TaxID=3155720 RepID=UPI0033D039F4